MAAKLKRLHGFAGYIVATLKTVFIYYPAPMVTIEYEDADTGERRSRRLPALMVSVMNGRRMGGEKAFCAPHLMPAFSISFKPSWIIV